MWNERLKAIDAKNTPLAAAKRWFNDTQRVELVNEGINLVYRFEHHNQIYYLRITHSALRLKSQLEASLHYQRHLFEHQAPVCEPIASQNDLWFESIWQENEEFLAHVCKEVPGEPMHFTLPSIDIYRKWGAALGQLHRAASSYDHTQHAYSIWSKSFEELEDYAQNEEFRLKEVLASVSQYFNRRIQTSHNCGLTHGDHRMGNVLNDGTQIHIIDFDLPCLNWFTSDLFRPFFDDIIHDQDVWQEKIKPYLEGYLSIMPKSSIDLNAFAWEVKMKCLEIYLWTKNNWSDTSAPGGGNTSAWLNQIYNKIICDDWIHKLTTP